MWELAWGLTAIGFTSSCGRQPCPVICIVILFYFLLVYFDFEFIFFIKNSPQMNNTVKCKCVFLSKCQKTRTATDTKIHPNNPVADNSSDAVIPWSSGDPEWAIRRIIRLAPSRPYALFHPLPAPITLTRPVEWRCPIIGMPGSPRWV